MPCHAPLSYLLGACLIRSGFPLPLELEVRPARRRRFHANVQSRVMTLLGFELQRSQPLGGEDGDGDEHALLD